jgi:pyruvate/2-oxoglutarate dehydrogenase complex dihydrolipoamide acyltransferase (E2) component
VVEWYQPDGAVIRRGQPLCCLESGYVAVDVEAEGDGVLQQRVAAGESGSPGDVLCVIEAAAAPAARVPAKPAGKGRGPAAPLAFPHRPLTGDGAAFDWDEVPGDSVDFDSGLFRLPGGDDDVEPAASQVRAVTSQPVQPVVITEPWAVAGPNLRTTARLTEAIKMRDQLTSQWRGAGLVVSVADVFVRAVARAWRETMDEDPAVTISTPGARQAVVTEAAGVAFRDVVAEAKTTELSEEQPSLRVISLLGTAVEEGFFACQPASVTFTFGSEREVVEFEGESVRPAAAVTVTLACDGAQLADEVAVQLLARVRTLVESPYALLVD